MTLDFTPTREDIKIRAGDDFPFVVRLVDTDDNPVPISGWDFFGDVINKGGLVIQSFELGDGFTVLDASSFGGKLQGNLTQNLGCIELKFDLQAISPDGIAVTFFTLFFHLSKDGTVVASAVVGNPTGVGTVIEVTLINEATVFEIQFVGGSGTSAKAYLNSLNFYTDDTAARLAGLVTGDHYKYALLTDSGIYGVIKEVTPP